VVLHLEEFLALVEMLENWLDTLQIVLGKNFKLLNGSKQLNQLSYSSTEEIKATEDCVWRKFKLFAFWHVHQAFFCELILLQVSLAEVDTSL
jgi:hypothetical protein